MILSDSVKQWSGLVLNSFLWCKAKPSTLDDACHRAVVEQEQTVNLHMQFCFSICSMRVYSCAYMQCVHATCQCQACSNMPAMKLCTDDVHKMSPIGWIAARKCPVLALFDLTLCTNALAHQDQADIRSVKVELGEPHTIPVWTLSSVFPEPCRHLRRNPMVEDSEPWFLQWIQAGTLNVADTRYDVTWTMLPDLQGSNVSVRLSKLAETLTCFLPLALKRMMPLPPYNCFQQGDLVPIVAKANVDFTFMEFRFRRYEQETWVDQYTCFEKDGSKVIRVYDHKTGNHVHTDANPSALKGRRAAI